jgi:8-oxo-dGTP pyrophosphatase MutT (NUDIX family)
VSQKTPSQKTFADYIRVVRALVGQRPLILTSVMVLIVDGDRLLMQKRAGTGAYHVPGGYLELGEKLEDAARREALEETALSVGDLTLVGAYSGPEFHWFAPNGDEIYNVTVAYLTKDFTGTPKADGDEGTDALFVPLAEMPENLGPPARPVLEDLRARGVL